MQFQKAQRKKAKLRLALSGPSGSGKTFSALLIAKGLAPGGRIAMIDTEGGSGELYADHEGMPEYHCLQFSPPYTPDRAVKAIQAAKGAGFDVVIFDSLSHVWMGEGGLLEMVDTAGQGLRGNTFAAWKAVRPHEKKFLEALVRTDIHIIVTMRTKTAWEITKDERTGKTKPVKLGLKPEQREGLEYEFTTVLDLAVDGNVASASKDRTALFRGKFFVPGEDTGIQLRSWLEHGADAPVPTPPTTPQPEQPAPSAPAQPAQPAQPQPAPGAHGPVVDMASDAQRKKIFAQGRELGLDKDQLLERCNAWLRKTSRPEVTSIADLDKWAASGLIEAMTKSKPQMDECPV
ncbi:ATP-binding protein [Desulfonatronum thiodismutans]|uniref:ATP-binding protein n=1 Tax=Desulfonatronum thiodismutans TaxID=159290 RepID=UPI0006893565|nr:ATP-binding protein [Desulfonatronum thiodismutans]